MVCTAECHTPRGRQAHCGACHKTFAGLSVFDQHRKGGRCNDLPTVTDKGGIWGTWGSSNGWWNKS